MAGCLLGRDSCAAGSSLPCATGARACQQLCFWGLNIFLAYSSSAWRAAGGLLQADPSSPRTPLLKSWFLGLCWCLLLSHPWPSFPSGWYLSSQVMSSRKHPLIPPFLEAHAAGLAPRPVSILGTGNGWWYQRVCLLGLGLLKVRRPHDAMTKDSACRWSHIGNICKLDYTDFHRHREGQKNKRHPPSYHISQFWLQHLEFS